MNYKYISKSPTIGIRPVIDGRENGVRESLEEQTLRMAQSVSDLISSQLRLSNGEEVTCIVPDFTIGGVADAARCADLFEQSNVKVSLTGSPCWCYGTEVMDSSPGTPKAIWGFNGTERPGAVYLAAALAGYSQKGIPAFSIYGHDVQDSDDHSIPDDVREKILSFARAGLAVAQIEGKIEIKHPPQGSARIGSGTWSRR